MPSISRADLADLLNKSKPSGGVASRCVQSFDYDLERETLSITFPGKEPGAHGGGGTWEYSDFPLTEFIQFAQAESLGTYFNLYIRNRYSSTRVD